MFPLFFAAMLVDELTKNDIMNCLPFVLEAGKVVCKKKINLVDITEALEVVLSQAWYQFFKG
jgi:hypothetical protein